MEKQSMIINSILSNDNLNRAYKQVVKNKGAAGIDGMECEALSAHLRTNGAQLKESIRNQAYNPLPKASRNSKRRWKQAKVGNSDSNRPSDTAGSSTGSDTNL